MRVSRIQLQWAAAERPMGAAFTMPLILPCRYLLADRCGWTEVLLGVFGWCVPRAPGRHAMVCKLLRTINKAIIFLEGAQALWLIVSHDLGEAG